MTQVADSFWRDANHVPITDGGLTVFSSKTLSANNTTDNVPIFEITGSVLIRRLGGVVTTALSSNVTAVSYRLNDQTAQTYLTVIAGTTASSIPTGSIIEKRGLAGVAVDVDSAAAAVFEEATTAGLPYYQEFRLTQKTDGVETDIEFKYTCNNQSSGAIQFFCTYIPISQDGNITAL